MKIKITILSILIIHFLSIKAFGEVDRATHFSASEIKQDIDSLIAGYKRYHPTFSNEQETKLNSLKNKINESISALELYRKVQPVVAKDLHTTIIYKDEIYPEIMNTYRMPCAVNEFESVKPDFKVIKTLNALMNDKDIILDSAIEVIKNKNR
jgi:hypothetical protein